VVFGVAFKVVVLMVRRPVWWDFFGIGEDGWSSSFPSVDLVLSHLKRQSRSVSSRNCYCYVVWVLCSKLKVNPEELILRARENLDTLASSVQRMADEYNDAGSVRYANHIIHLAKTFFRVNKLELDVHGYFQSTRSRKRPEYVPSLQEALKIADVVGNLRDRLIILLLTYAGLRNSTLRALAYSENYPDLLLQDFTLKKEFEKRKTCLVIIVHEIMKLRVPNAAKNRVFYYTFASPIATDCLYLYLQEMERKYGPLQDDFLIFHTSNRKIPLWQRLKTPISCRELELIVEKAARRADIKNWKYVYPHCLRKTYEGFLRNQSDDVRLDEKEREFLFGHTLPGSQDTYFDKTKIEEMRAKYAKMNFEPGITVEREERVICEDDLPTYLQNGWHFEATLPSQKVVISRKVKVKQSEDAPSAENLHGSAAPARAEKATQLKSSLEPSAPMNQSIKLDTATEVNKATIEYNQPPHLREEVGKQRSKELQHSQDEHSVKDTKEKEAKDTYNPKPKQRSLLDFSEGHKLP
jgi:integrase